MKLVLFGGIQGVGKTTLLSWLRGEFAGQFGLLDPGELFRRYFYEARIKTTEEIEELVVGKIEEAPDNAVMVLHWHYAVRRPDGYIPQIGFSRLKRLTKSDKLEKVVLVLVEAPANIVLERRLKEHRTKQRSFSLPIINEEFIADEKFFIKQRALFSQALGDQRVIVFRLTNVDLSAAKLSLGEFFRTLLD